MRNFPGLTAEQTEQMKGNMGKVRCQKCDACKGVEVVKRVLAPNPPFSHANNSMVEAWNNFLFKNPCETWK